jgi:hypothetical protein
MPLFYFYGTCARDYEERTKGGKIRTMFYNIKNAYGSFVKSLPLQPK